MYAAFLVNTILALAYLAPLVQQPSPAPVAVPIEQKQTHPIEREPAAPAKPAHVAPPVSGPEKRITQAIDRLNLAISAVSRSGVDTTSFRARRDALLDQDSGRSSVADEVADLDLLTAKVYLSLSSRQSPPASDTVPPSRPVDSKTNNVIAYIIVLLICIATSYMVARLAIWRALRNAGLE